MFYYDVRKVAGYHLDDLVLTAQYIYAGDNCLKSPPPLNVALPSHVHQVDPVQGTPEKFVPTTYCFLF